MWKLVTIRDGYYAGYLDFEYWKSSFAAHHEIHPKVLSFLEDNQCYRYNLPNSCDSPSPYVFSVPFDMTSFDMWSYLSGRLYHIEKYDIHAHALYYIAPACVGELAGSEFVSYYTHHSENDEPA